MSKPNPTQLRQVFARHPHWQNVISITQTLKEHGFKAYLAGGAVRDALLGEPLHDFDVVTNAVPEDLEKLFDNALDIGKQFGIMMIPIGNDSGRAGHHRVEIATFRSDGAYLDGRHPASVIFSSAEEDAKRRDFTVNALFYDIEKDEVIDFVGGLDDLQAGLIRAVGDPALRFREDKLRLLRAIRFSAQLSFQIESETYRAICALASEILVVSRERITNEVERLAQARAISTGFAALIDSGLFRVLFKSLHFIDEDRMKQIFFRALTRLSGIGSLELVLALMLLIELHTYEQNIAKDDKKLLGLLETHLSLSRAAHNRIGILIKGVEALKNNPEECFMLLDSDDGPLLSELGFALEAVGLLPPHQMGNTLARYLEVADSNGRLPSPYINGNDLLVLGVPPTPRFGEILAEVYKQQLRGEIASRDDALAIAKKLAAK